MARLEQVKEVEIDGKPAVKPQLLIRLLEDARVGAILAEAWLSNPVSVQSAGARLKAAGYPVAHIRAAEKLAATNGKRLATEAKRATSRAVVRPADDDRARVDEELADIIEPGTLPPGLVVPEGWVLRPCGLARWIYPADDAPYLREVCAAPLLVTGRLTDVRTGKAQVAVSWYYRDRRGARWRSRTVPRSVVADRRGVVTLADDHAPITSDNAGDIVAYLYASEAANEGVLPVAQSSSALGWQPDGSFLLGDTLFGQGLEQVVDSSAPSSAWEEGHVQLVEDELVSELAAGYRTGGTLEGWKKAAEKVADRPGVQLALYAALIPPLMRWLGEIPNFAADWSGDTSIGKTTASRFAASIWGVPDEHAAATCLRTWKQTRVWIESAAARCSGLPLILDDSKKAKPPETVQQVLYDVEDGHGAGRGRRDGGGRATVAYRTVLISTGEYPITTIGRTSHGGAVARVIEIHGSPLGGASEANRDLSKALAMDLREHHGHAGRELIRWLLAADRVPWLRERYREHLAYWAAKAGDNAVAGRAADYMAALALGRDLVGVVLGLPDCAEALPLAWTAVQRNTHRADVAWTAMQAVLSWVGSQRHRFMGSSATLGIRTPPASWLGVWEDAPGWTEIAVEPVQLRRFLAELGYESTGAFPSAWAARGWLRCEDDGEQKHLTAKVRFNGLRPRYFCIQRAAWNAVFGD